MAATIPSFVVCWYAPFHVKQQAGEPPMELKKAA
jgi:hypothetical protein